MSFDLVVPLPTLLPVALLLLQAGLNVPQLVRLFRAEHGGVPLAGEALSLVGGLGWLVWAALEGDAAIGLSAVLALAGFGPSTWLLVRAGSPWRVAALLAAAVGGVGLLGLLLGGLGVFATLLTGFAVVQYGAYLTAARRCTDWSGYSPASGALRVVYGLGWALHGRWQGNVLLVAWGLMTAGTFAITFATATTWRRRAATPETAGAGQAPTSTPVASRPSWTQARRSASGSSSATRSS